MVKKSLSLLTGCCLLGLATTASAVVVFEEAFPDPDGPAADRPTTVGAGNLDVTGSIAYLGGSIVLTADGGNERIELESSAAAPAGSFTFDASRTGTGNNNVFVQLVDGIVRNTGGSPEAAFTDTLNLGSAALGGVTTPTPISYFFNVSGAAITYTAPDGSTASLANNAYDLYVGNTLTGGDDQTSATGGVPTAGVDTLVLQTFGAQSGGVYTFDNFVFSTIVPEPSATLLVGLGLGLGLTSRRRRNR